MKEEILKVCSQCKKEVYLLPDESICYGCWVIIEANAMDDSHLWESPEQEEITDA